MEYIKGQELSGHVATAGSRIRQPPISSRACYELAYWAIWRNDFEEAKAIAMAEEISDERLLGGEVLLSRIYSYQHTMKPVKMVEAGDPACASGRPWDLSSVLGPMMLAWCFIGKFEEAAASPTRQSRWRFRRGTMVASPQKGLGALG